MIKITITKSKKTNEKMWNTLATYATKGHLKKVIEGER